MMPPAISSPAWTYRARVVDRKREADEHDLRAARDGYRRSAHWTASLPAAPGAASHSRRDASAAVFCPGMSWHA